MLHTQREVVWERNRNRHTQKENKKRRTFVFHLFLFQFSLTCLFVIHTHIHMRVLWVNRNTFSYFLVVALPFSSTYYFLFIFDLLSKCDIVPHQSFFRLLCRQSHSLSGVKHSTNFLFVLDCFCQFRCRRRCRHRCRRRFHVPKHEFCKFCWDRRVFVPFRCVGFFDLNFIPSALYRIKNKNTQKAIQTCTRKQHSFILALPGEGTSTKKRQFLCLCVRKVNRNVA